MAGLSDLIQSIFQINQVASEIIASILTFSLVIAIGWAVYFILSRYFSKWAQKTRTTLDDVILGKLKTIIILLTVIIGFYYALSSLTIIQPFAEQLSAIFIIVEILLIAFAITRVTGVLADWHVKKTSETRHGKNHHLLFLMKKLTQLFVYIGAFLIILYVFNIDLSGVVVGLGVGGIALAFAVQSQLGDVLGAFSIYFDRPFEIGDFIVVGDYSGTVTNIGVKSTRLKLLQGEELVISNRELSSSSIRNYRKLERRRVTFTLGIAYDTPLSKLKKIPELTKQIINAVGSAEVDRVNFTEFGDYSLKFLVIYYVNFADYGTYLDTQEKINYALKEAFENEGIEFAFPTQTVIISKS